MAELLSLGPTWLKWMGLVAMAIGVLVVARLAKGLWK
jgi:uncharacterized protein YjeT (DUF2065 family)